MFKTVRFLAEIEVKNRLVDSGTYFSEYEGGSSFFGDSLKHSHNFVYTAAGVSPGTVYGFASE